MNRASYQVTEVQSAVETPSRILLFLSSHPTPLSLHVCAVVVVGGCSVNRMRRPYLLGNVGCNDLVRYNDGRYSVPEVFCDGDDSLTNDSLEHGENMSYGYSLQVGVRFPPYLQNELIHQFQIYSWITKKINKVV